MSGLLVAGTSSDAGKSVVTTGLCRAFARRGVKVAPYKAQNMSNNSMVTRDGGEIGRAQWVQAMAAKVEPEISMNPVLLKPGSDQRSHVVTMGKPDGHVDASNWEVGRARLARIAHAAFDDLATRFDVVVAEGAGSPAEINLRRSDYVNMGLARHANLPVVVVGDIDRGGIFASFIGTLALLDDADARLLAGWVVNKFRGNRELLQPGLDQLQELTSRPVYGVLPWQSDIWLDSEDSLDIAARPADTSGTRRVAVVRLPRISNFTDIDALALEPALDVIFASTPAALTGADLIVIPGTRATIADLAWLRERGMDKPIMEHAASGRPVLGICGGCQILGREIRDPDGVEGRPMTVPGLGLLDLVTTFAAEKVLRLHHPAGYEIHHGRVRGQQRSGAVAGTMVHGTLEDDDYRSDYLGRALGVSSNASFPAARQRRLDLLGNLVEDHLDVDLILRLAREGI
jgi:adenosylcobyric acid synthase